MEVHHLIEYGINSIESTSIEQYILITVFLIISWAIYITIDFNHLNLILHKRATSDEIGTLLFGGFAIVIFWPFILVILNILLPIGIIIGSVIGFLYSIYRLIIAITKPRK